MPIDLANPGRPIRVGVILLNGVTEVLDVAPVEFIHEISHGFVDQMPDDMLAPELKAQALHTEFHWVSESGKPSLSKLTSGMSMQATDSFETAPPLDIVLIGATLGHEPTETELAYIRKCYEECAAFITVCSGIEPPLKAGILEGKTATAPRAMLDTLREHAPGTNWVEKRWARDGKLWTSGTLLNGLDLMTSFILQTWPSGKGTLIDLMMKSCAWPNRDPLYKDVTWGREDEF